MGQVIQILITFLSIYLIPKSHAFQIPTIRDRNLG